MDNRKKLIIAVIIFISVSLITIAAVIIIKSSTPTLQKRTTTTSIDPISGETVIRGNDAPVTGPDTTPNQPTYLGLSALVDRGLSITQVNILQDALTSYSLNNKVLFKQVSLNKDTISRIMPAAPSDPSALTFTVVVNNKDSYFIRVDYTTPDSITTKLYKADKTTLLFTQ